jgi:hypothetical protein
VKRLLQRGSPQVGSCSRSCFYRGRIVGMLQ